MNKEKRRRLVFPFGPSSITTESEQVLRTFNKRPTVVPNWTVRVHLKWHPVPYLVHYFWAGSALYKEYGVIWDSPCELFHVQYDLLWVHWLDEDRGEEEMKEEAYLQTTGVARHWHWLPQCMHHRSIKTHYLYSHTNTHRTCTEAYTDTQSRTHTHRHAHTLALPPSPPCSCGLSEGQFTAPHTTTLFLSF